MKVRTVLVRSTSKWTHAIIELQTLSSCCFLTEMLLFHWHIKPYTDDIIVNLWSPISFSNWTPFNTQASILQNEHPNLLITRLCQLFTMHFSLTDTVFAYRHWRNLTGSKVLTATGEDTDAGSRFVFYRIQDALTWIITHWKKRRVLPTLKEISKFSPPHISIPASYVPISWK